MKNLFEIIPSGFFNCLSSGSNNWLYSDCLQIIYEQYDREISYRLPRNHIRDALAAYLLENHVELIDVEAELGAGKCYNELANNLIRKFCTKEIGWLEEDNDDATYVKHIIMSESGILLAEFLEKLRKPEREEFSSYIFNIYNTLKNEEQWFQNPYVDGLKSIYRNSKQLSKALKRLTTFIKKIIGRMVEEESLESLTENIIEYCEGDFIREYARLTKQQNIRIYRSFIKSKLDTMQNDKELFELLVIGCALEEELEEDQAEERVFDMLQAAKRFLFEDYDLIMRDIKHKINVYLQIAVGRARFLRNREANDRGNVERTVHYIVNEMNQLEWKEEMPDEINQLFALEKNEFIDTGSLRFPRKLQTIKRETFAELEEMTEEDIARAKSALEKEAYNPYSKDQMKTYFEDIMGAERMVSSEALPLQSKSDLLCTLSAAAYGQENGYQIRLLAGYREEHQMILHNFEIVKEDV